MRKVFVILTRVLTFAIAAQFFLAAMGAFDVAPKEEAFAPHRALGYSILLFSLLLTGLAAALRLPGRLVGLTGLVTGLVLLQPIIRSIAGALGGSGDTTSLPGKLVFGLHAVNAVFIAMLVDHVGRQASESREVQRANDANNANNATAADRVTEPSA